MRTGFGILAALGLIFSMFAIATPAFADGDDSPEACKTSINVDAGDSGQSADEVSFTADAGEVVTAVCIKSGNNAFGDKKHSDLLTADGTYGDGCYTVAGIGTDTVTVTRTDSSDCKGISHVDVVTGPGQSPEESPAESPKESPEESPAESPKESPEESPAESPEESPAESPEESPAESPEESPAESPEESPAESPREGEEGGNPTATPGGGTVPDTALGSTSVPAWPFAILFLSSLVSLLYLRLTTESDRIR
jgi:hypothetical protein